MRTSRPSSALLLAVALAATLLLVEGERGVAASRPSLFGVEPVTTPPDPPFSAADAREVKALGARRVRVWIFWNAIEDRKEGKQYLRTLDRQVNRLSRIGVEVVAVVLGSPKRICRVRTGHAGLYSCPPRLGPPAYRRFLYWVVQRYRSKIKYWEIWNEPNGTAYWTSGASPLEYARLLKAAYKAIKRTDRKAKVVMGAPDAGAWGVGDEIDESAQYYPYMAFTDRMLAALAGARAFDIVSLHPYRGPKGPNEQRSVLVENGERKGMTLREELLHFRDLFARHGYQGKPLWLTEMGWGAAPDDRVEGWLVTTARQAQFLEELYTQVQNDRELSFVETIFWFNLRDLPAEAEGSEGQFVHFGLLRRDYSPKPAYETYRRLATGQ